MENGPKKNNTLQEILSDFSRSRGDTKKHINFLVERLKNMSEEERSDYLSCYSVHFLSSAEQERIKKAFKNVSAHNANFSLDDEFILEEVEIQLNMMKNRALGVLKEKAEKRKKY